METEKTIATASMVNTETVFHQRDDRKIKKERFD